MRDNKTGFNRLVEALVMTGLCLLGLAKFLLELRRDWFNMLPSPRRDRRDWFILPLILVLLGSPAWGQGHIPYRAVVLLGENSTDAALEQQYSTSTGVEKQRALLHIEARADVRRGMSQSTVERRLARDLVLLDVPNADRFTRTYGDASIRVLRNCSIETSQRLVRMFEAGDFARIDVPALLEIINRLGHGEKVAVWVCENHERLRDPAALQRFVDTPLEYVFALRDLESDAKQPVPQPKAATVDALKAWVMDREHWPIMGGVAALILAIAYFKRRKARPPAAPASSPSASVAEMLGKVNTN